MLSRCPSMNGRSTVDGVEAVFLVGRTASELLVARRGAGSSQRELGRLLRVSHTKIGRVERGEPNQLTIELAATMAAVLGPSSASVCILTGTPSATPGIQR